MASSAAANPALSSLLVGSLAAVLQSSVFLVVGTRSSIFSCYFWPRICSGVGFPFSEELGM